MSAMRYWQQGELRFEFATEPRYDCPIGEATRFSPDDEPSAKVRAAADALGMDPHRLGVMLRKSSCGAREIVNDRKIDRCVSHGVKMRKRGYLAQITEPIPEGEWSPAQRTSVAFNQRVGDPEYVPRRVVESRYEDTRREAKAWAYAKFCDARKGVVA